MGLNHVHAPTIIGRNLSRYNLQFVLLQDIANRGQEARLSSRAHANVGILTAHVQDDIRRSPCLENGSPKSRD